MRCMSVNPHCNFRRFGRGHMNELAGVGMLSIWVVTYLLVSTVPDNSWLHAIWYGVKYNVAFTQVNSNNKPSDCDWTHSLLGSKGCQYRTAVGTYNDDGELIAVDAATPEYRYTKHGGPIVSFDGGKTWKWETPTTTIKKVSVQWVKVME
jgi:hypothetical protein